MGNGDGGETADPVRVPAGGDPGHHGPPVVTDQIEPIEPLGIGHGQDVGHQGTDPVVVDQRGPGPTAVAALVEGQSAKSGPGQSFELVMPRPRRLGETMEKQDRTTVGRSGGHGRKELTAGHHLEALHGRRPGGISR